MEKGRGRHGGGGGGRLGFVRVTAAEGEAGGVGSGEFGGWGGFARGVVEGKSSGEGAEGTADGGEDGCEGFEEVGIGDGRCDRGSDILFVLDGTEGAREGAQYLGREARGLGSLERGEDGLCNSGRHDERLTFSLQVSDEGVEFQFEVRRVESSQVESSRVKSVRSG